MFGSKVSCPATEEAAKYVPPPPVGQPWSVAVPGSEQPGRTPVYRHWRRKDTGPVTSFDPSISTYHEAFEQSAASFPKNNCLGHRPYNAATKSFGPYVWQTYAQVHKRRADFGAGLVALYEQAGVTGPQHGVGLWCLNRPEWQIVDLGCVSQALYSVSIYDTLGPDTTEYIINHASLTGVCASVNHIPTLIKLAPRCPSLKFIVSLDPLSTVNEQAGTSKKELLQALASEHGIQIHYLEDVEAMGAAAPRPYRAPRPEDLVTLNYTSGTTGNPKGVMLTHANAIAAASAALTIAAQTGHDVGLSYLPLAHIFERVSEQAALWCGASLGYFHGNILELPEDLQLLKPTVFISVPRLLNRFGGAIKARSIEAPGFRGALSRRVVETKLANLQNAEPGKATNKHLLYDRIWARKVQKLLGLQRTHTMISGSAPLDPSLQQFLRIVFCNNFLQGYGLTETYAIALMQTTGDFSAGNCGLVSVATEACLQDVPDMDYLSTDKPYPRGELLLRGTTVMTGYYKNEAETAKATTEDGWFRTGDIAEIDHLGRVRIVDRVKNVLKLAQGEYISPERIENVYLGNLPFLAQGYVHGDSTQASLVAVFAVQPDIFATFAGKVLGKEISEHDLDAIAAAGALPEVRRAVLQEMAQVGKKAKFNRYEHVKAVRLLVEPFTTENELITPTMKLKRPQTAKFYRALLDEMYAEVEAQTVPRARL